MRILVLEHERGGNHGIFRQFLRDDGHSWDTVYLTEAEALPPLDGYDALWVMGGSMNVWQEQEHPWLVPEKALIKRAVKDQGLPYLGLCLGHQLLAVALGGAVAPAATPEIGVMDVQVIDAGGRDVLFDALPDRFLALQWHEAEVTKLPQGAQVLANSPVCAVQAMRWGARAYGLQFHIEIEADTVANWLRTPANAAALEAAAGKDAAARMLADCATNMAGFNKMAERLYRNWLRATA